jgi:Monooxygenase af470-like
MSMVRTLAERRDRRPDPLREDFPLPGRQEVVMVDINQGRWTAEIEGDFVVFIIGARINSKRHVFKALRDLGGSKGMNHMLKYLSEHPEKGFLGYQSMGLVNVQYWRSFEHLEAFAKNTDDPHLEPWRNYWKRVGKDGRTGIWHETYLVRNGEYEAIYGNMPPTGLGKASRLVPVAESVMARQRIKAAVRGD